MVIWITGKAGAGKTFLAKNLKSQLNNINYPCLIIDGDELRKIVDYGYSHEGRYKNVMFASKLAGMSEEQGIIAIISMVSPIKEHRFEARQLFKNSELIHVLGGKLWEGSVYDEPDEDEASFIYDWRNKTVVRNSFSWVGNFLKF